MRTFRLLYLAFLAAMAVNTAYAQGVADGAPEDVFSKSLIEDTKVIYFGGEPTDSLAYREHLNQFYQDQFRHAQDPRAPYFMMMSRNGQLGMGIGGELKMMGNYDWDGSQDGMAFNPYNIPIPLDPTNKNHLQMTPNRTAIYFSVFGNTEHLGHFQIFVHARFNGPDHTFKMNLAYATLGDWTLGYAKSTFDDPTAQPATVEIQGPNSEIDDTRMLLRYMHSLNKNVTMAVSVENPNENVESTTHTAKISTTVPDVGAFMQYAFGQQHVRLSGIVRNLGYRNMIAASNHHVMGWGLNLSAKLRPVAPLTIYAAVNTGRGIGSLVNDLQNGQNDLLPLASSPGRMYAPASYGWYGALQYHYTPTVFSTVIFSQERILPKHDAVYGGDNYKYGLYGTANVFWNIAPRLQIGGEFTMGKRANIDGVHRMGYRASFMAELSF